MYFLFEERNKIKLTWTYPDESESEDLTESTTQNFIL